MTMQTWQNTDKSKWPQGPWQNEPDKAQWITAAGLDGLIVRGPSGALCGYVGLPSSHPLYGKHYNAAGDVDVHGDLTFADACQPSDDPAHKICHVEEFAAHKTVWWLGFDCAHVGDYCPQFEAIALRNEDSQYRDLAYVQAQVESLAHQLLVGVLTA